MKKKSREIHHFFSEKNIQDRLNAIVRFVLYANKKTGLCHEKISRPKNMFLSPINSPAESGLDLE